MEAPINFGAWNSARCEFLHKNSVPLSRGAGTYISENHLHLYYILQKRMLQSHHHLKRRGESEEKPYENLRVPNGPRLTLSPQSKPNIVVIKLASNHVESARSTSSPLCLRYPPTPYSFFLSSSYPPSPSRVYLINSTLSSKVTIRRLQQRWAQYYQSRQSRSVLIPAHSGMAQMACS